MGACLRRTTLVRDLSDPLLESPGHRGRPPPGRSFNEFLPQGVDAWEVRARTVPGLQAIVATPATGSPAE